MLLDTNMCILMCMFEEPIYYSSFSLACMLTKMLLNCYVNGIGSNNRENDRK